MGNLDRRAVRSGGLAAAAAAAGILAGYDSSGMSPATAGGSLVLPGSPLVAEAEKARYTTGRVRSEALRLVSREVGLGGPVVRT